MFCKQSILQLGEGLCVLLRIICFQSLSQLADRGSDLLGLNAQLPEGAGYVSNVVFPYTFRVI